MKTFKEVINEAMYQLIIVKKGSDAIISKSDIPDVSVKAMKKSGDKNVKVDDKAKTVIITLTP